MKSLFTKATLALALGASTLVMAAPAQAQRYGGYHGRDDGGTALVAGVAGLAIGAALASDGNRGDGYYRDEGYDYGYVAPVYAPPIYAAPIYGGYGYAQPYYDRGYGRYYDDRRGYRGGRHDYRGHGGGRDHHGGRGW